MQDPALPERERRAETVAEQPACLTEPAHRSPVVPAKPEACLEDASVQLLVGPLGIRRPLKGDICVPLAAPRLAVEAHVDLAEGPVTSEQLGQLLFGAREGKVANKEPAGVQDVDMVPPVLDQRPSTLVRLKGTKKEVRCIRPCSVRQGSLLQRSSHLVSIPEEGGRGLGSCLVVFVLCPLLLLLLLLLAIFLVAIRVGRLFLSTKHSSPAFLGQSQVWGRPTPPALASQASSSSSSSSILAARDLAARDIVRWECWRQRPGIHSGGKSGGSLQVRQVVHRPLVLPPLGSLLLILLLLL